MADAGVHHEVRDVSARVPVIGIGATVVTAIACGFFVWFLLNSVWQPPPSQAPPVQRGAIKTPTPRLQLNPKTDLAVFQARMRQRLNGFGWVDRDAGLVHIPIDQAMSQLVERGLPDKRGTHPTGGGEGQ